MSEDEKPKTGAVIVTDPKKALVTAESAAPGANSDEAVFRAWLGSKRSPHTRRAYVADVAAFRAVVKSPMASVALQELQDWAASLRGSEKSRARRIAAVRSLFRFAFRVGYIRFDPAAVIPVPQAKNTLAERILSQDEVKRMLSVKHDGARLLRFLYASGARLEEALRLTWRDFQPREGGGQVTLFGKRSKTRVVRLSQKQIESLGTPGRPDEPIFPVSQRTARRQIRAIANAAGISKNVSPHWLRHAHASHALERGASLPLVQATLGHEDVATTGNYVHVRPTESSARFLDDD